MTALLNDINNNPTLMFATTTIIITVLSAIMCTISYYSKEPLSFNLMIWSCWLTETLTILCFWPYSMGQLLICAKTAGILNDVTGVCIMLGVTAVMIATIILLFYAKRKICRKANQIMEQKVKQPHKKERKSL